MALTIKEDISLTCAYPLFGCPVFLQLETDQPNTDYYVKMTIKDKEDLDEICAIINRPLSVYGSENLASFELSSIIDSLSQIKSPPFNPSSGEFKIDNFLKEYMLDFEGQYTEFDPSNLDNCERTTEVGPTIESIKFINYAQKNINDTLNPCSNNLVLTAMDEDSLICMDSIIQFIVFNQNGIESNIEVQVIGTDDSGLSQIIDIPFTLTGADNKVVRVSFKPNEIFNTKKSFIRVLVDGNTTPLDITLQVDKELCCRCHRNFNFLSSQGNWDTISSLCELSIDQTSTFIEVCKDANCFDSGISNIGYASNTDTRQVLLKSDSVNLLREFIQSASKVTCDEDGVFFEIKSAASTYNIYTASDNKHYIQYTYITQGLQKLISL